MKIKIQICTLLTAIEIALSENNNAEEVFVSADNHLCFRNGAQYTIRRECEVIEEGVVLSFDNRAWRLIHNSCIDIAKQHKANEVILEVRDGGYGLIDPRTNKVFVVTGMRLRYFKFYFSGRLKIENGPVRNSRFNVGFASQEFPTNEEAEIAVRNKCSLNEAWVLDDTGMYEFASEDDYVRHFKR